MTKKIPLIALLFLLVLSASAGDKKKKEKVMTAEDSLEWITGIIQAKYDSIEQSVKYERGSLTLNNKTINVNVIKGFKFVNKEDSRTILEKYYHNPPDESVLGLIFPEDRGVFTDSSYFFVITYSDMGHVEDDDAEDMNYDELLTELKKDASTANAERERLGYRKAWIVGWASQPYYDKDKKVLHWAKEVKFEGDSTNTLNYEVRILGRNGVLVLEAVAGIEQLKKVKANINNIFGMVSFSDGNKYENFDSGIDKVAAVGIGGLIAGKILAKAGFFALLIKFWKIIAVGVVAAFAGIRKFLSRKSDAPKN
jgi:uncharacterized membrane-anchored protein